MSCIIIYIGLNSYFDYFQYGSSWNVIPIIIAIFCVLIIRQISKAYHQSFLCQIQEKIEDQHHHRRRTNQHIRKTNICSLNGCDFEHHDTIPSTQLDMNVFNTADLQHIKQCHHDLYWRLKLWTQPKWENAPAYFIQITVVDLIDFNMQLIVQDANNSAKKYF
eukprot:414399_1